MAEVKMFESDDFDQVLSQFDFGDIVAKNNEVKENVCTPNSVVNTPIIPVKDVELKSSSSNITTVIAKDRNVHSPKHCKRKIINSHFDHKKKRKFPGPAGLLAGNLEEFKDESICHMELLSQDIDFTQNLRKDLFESPIWRNLLDNIKHWNLTGIDLINDVKQQAVTGNLRRRKAKVIAAFVEIVDRSITDTLITLRDTTGTIKCTLHKDAWKKFAPYIVAEYCALVLWKPTVLTTGGAFKKHYLNITLSNVLAIYSSVILKEQEQELPEGYSIIYEGDFTVIKKENYQQDIGTNSSDITDAMLDGLDTTCFDDLF